MSDALLRTARVLMTVFRVPYHLGIRIVAASAPQQQLITALQTTAVAPLVKVAAALQQLPIHTAKVESPVGVCASKHRELIVAYQTAHVRKVLVEGVRLQTQSKITIATADVQSRHDLIALKRIAHVQPLKVAAALQQLL